MSEVIQVKLSKWQTEVWEDKSRFKVINVGRRGGKSTYASLRMVYEATEKAGSIVWYLAPTYRQAQEIMWEMIKTLIPEGMIKGKDEVKLTLDLVNGSKIILKGVQDPDSLRGVRIDLAIFDEVAFMDKWDTVWKVIRPTLIDNRADVVFISTPNGFNHFYDLFHREAKDKRYKSFHYTSYDNPYLEREELEQTRHEMDGDAFAQEFLGEFRKMSGLIYKDFDRGVHMVEIPSYIDHNWTFTRSLDFGYGHKTALGYFAIKPDGTEIYLYDGLYLEGLTIPDVAEIIKGKDAGRYITQGVADSSQPASIKELNRMGIRFRGVEKKQDSIKNGVAKVVELMKVRKDTGKPTLMFNKNLDWIAKEFEGYRWIESKGGDGVIKEVPFKVNDDAMDMIRYFGLEYRGSEEIQDPNEGWADEVKLLW